ncbi:MAG: dienelactone hydrolase family protein [Planctomycetes bacterium]|nr:dienelactone hydrolase family protein [Planctomycetota bacterium]
MNTTNSRKRLSIALFGCTAGALILAAAFDARAEDPAKTDALRRDIRKAYRSADYKKALKAATQLHELNPDEPTPMYNMACMHARLGEKDKAYTWLERSVEAGYGDADHLYGDADFKQLWGEERFRNIVKSIRERANTGDKADKKVTATDKPKKPKPDNVIEIPKVPNLTPREHQQKQQELTRELIEVAPKGEHKKALGLALEALAHAKALEKAVGERAAPTVSLCHYNVACMLSLLKKSDEAFAQLNTAVDVGGWPFDEMLQQMAGDSDLTNIRKDPRYDAVIRRLKGEKPAQEAKKPDPKTSKEGPSAEKAKRDASSMTADERAARIEELVPLLMKASQQGKLKEALDYALEAVSLDDSALTNYNAACMYSLNKETDKAFEHLFKAFDQGGLRGNPVQQLKNDTDLNNLHGDARWKKAMGVAQKMLDEKNALPKDIHVDFQYEVTLPPRYDSSKPAPLVVALHHYHGNMNTTMERWKEPAANVGAILLTPQGTYEAGESSGLFQWGDDLSEIEANVMKAINEVMDKHRIDDRHVAIVGFSQGAAAALGVMARNPDAFCGVVSVAGYFKPESQSVFADDDLKGRHIYFMVGAEDNSQLIQTNRRAVDLFSKAGAAANLVVFDGIGHGFPDKSVEEQTKALRFVLGS